MELDYIQIGQRLKTLRGKLSQAAFGELISYGYGYVKNCEHGKKPSLEYLHKVVEYYGSSIEWILYGTDPICSNCSANIQKIEAVFDPDLKEMIDVLKNLMESGDPDLRGWAKIQFKNAFREHCATIEEKKHHA